MVAPIACHVRRPTALRPPVARQELTRQQAQTWQSSPTWSSTDKDRLGVPGLTMPEDRDRLPQPSPTGLRGRLQSLRRATSPARSKTSQSPEGTKGALGLTLLHEPSEPRVDFIFVRLSEHKVCHHLTGYLRYTASTAARGGPGAPPRTLPPSGQRNGSRPKPASDMSASTASAMIRTGQSRSTAL